MKRRRKRGLRGLAGDVNEHEQRMHKLAASARHLVRSLGSGAYSGREQCAAAVGAVSDAAAAKEHSYYVKGSERFRRELDAIHSAVMRALHSGACGR